MKTPQSRWRLAIAGLGHRGHFFWERWRLLNPSRVVALADDDPLRQRSVGAAAIPLCSLSELARRPGDCTAVLVTVPLSQRGTLVADLLTAGLSVLVEPPIAPSLSEGRQLLALAQAQKVALRVIGLRRSEPDFIAALAAMATGRLGPLAALRWHAAEYAVRAGDPAADYRRGETLAAAGPPIFDQLAGLTAAIPETIWGRAFSAEDGFAADIQFVDGSGSHLELRRTARAALRTGWMIEGITGTYHQRRLITTTIDGELVDEAMPVMLPVNDPLGELESMMDLEPMTEAEQYRSLITAGLLDAVQRSIATNSPVEWKAL